MGVWSYPLFTRCYDAEGKVVDKEAVVMTFYKTDHEQDMGNLHWHNTDVMEGTRTFEAAIMNTCDCAKIWGYLDSRELKCWDAFFTRLLEQNPRVYRAEAHFYCVDSALPYYIFKKRNGANQQSLNRIRIRHGSPGHCLFYVLNFDAEEGEEWKFNPEMYQVARDEHDNLFDLAMDEYHYITRLL